jgi:type 1 glutamine amidotransferase
VVLRCGALTGNTKLPIAWYRNEGAGRVFYSSLGHTAEDFAPGSLLMKDHFLPGALWALGK